MHQVNDHLVLVAGFAASGKSASLGFFREPEKVMYLNCENGKRLPFRSSKKFKQLTVTDPYLIYQAFEEAENLDVNTIVVDSLTYMMDLFESMYVLTASKKERGDAWQEFQQFFKKLMQHYVANSTKKVIFTAHVLDQLNEKEMVLETKVPVKGALKNVGIESYFSTIVYSKRVGIEKLKDFDNDLLNITEADKRNKFKYVFQTLHTEDTINERIRAPMDMWAYEETYIDNNVQKLIDRLNEFYEDED